LKEKNGFFFSSFLFISFLFISFLHLQRDGFLPSDILDAKQAVNAKQVVGGRVPNLNILFIWAFLPKLGLKEKTSGSFSP